MVSKVVLPAIKAAGSEPNGINPLVSDPAVASTKPNRKPTNPVRMKSFVVVLAVLGVASAAPSLIPGGYGHGAALAGPATGPNSLIGPSNGPNALAGPTIGPTRISGAVDLGAVVTGAVAAPSTVIGSAVGGTAVLGGPYGAHVAPLVPAPLPAPAYAPYGPAPGMYSKEKLSCAPLLGVVIVIRKYLFSNAEFDQYS